MDVRRTNTLQGGSPQAKEAAKQCLKAADRYIKDSLFEKARQELDKAKQLDPANIYIEAFQDRIAYFEEQERKEAADKPQRHMDAPEEIAVNTAEEERPEVIDYREEERRRAQEDRMRKVEEEYENRGEEKKFLEEEARRKTEEELKRLEEEIQREAFTETTERLEEKRTRAEELQRKLEEEEHHHLETAEGWERLEGEQQPFGEEAIRKAEEQGRRRARMKKLKEFIMGAEDFFLAKDYDAALTDISKALALDPISEVAHKLFEEIDQAQREESRRLEGQRARDSLERLADQYKGTILLISSDPAISTDLPKKLKTSGYAVVSAPNPESALDKIEKIHPNIILSDIEFPEENLSGIKFLHVLRLNSKFSFIPFIFLCDRKDMDQLQSSELRPIEGFVQKPVDVNELIAVMNEKLKHFRDYISNLMT